MRQTESEETTGDARHNVKKAVGTARQLVLAVLVVADTVTALPDSTLEAMERRVLILLLLCPVLCSGCVSRRMTIRSEPAEALVEVDGKQLGLTPLSLDFTFYGTREITLSKPGFETLTVQQPVARPWNQSVPFDFFTMHFRGSHITDRHNFLYRLREKQIPVNEESELINRGQNLRSQSQIGPLQ